MSQKYVPIERVSEALSEARVVGHAAIDACERKAKIYITYALLLGIALGVSATVIVWIVISTR